MEKKDTHLKYQRAKNKVEKLKRFYSHLTVYLIANTLVSTFKIIRNIKNGETFNEAFFDFGTFFVWTVWGLAIAIHAFSVFIMPLLVGEDWEERKIEEIMKEEMSNKSKY
ncbi:2TM domain-containing protein [Winogradskyella ursingii]|uniref:2TM domain-containing protein n=1 Tax=Winogradskyella ursingii TaxID=2686079 RepID=UPI0015CAFF81|nr:2TM domain-containing protein [Winogradskyella ursingii]